MIKKLFKNMLHDAETLASDAEQSAETYTDSKFQSNNGTGTATSAVASVERCIWTQVGNIVALNATFTTASSGVSATSVFFTGLPKPIQYMRFNANRPNNNSTFRLGLEQDGTLRNAYSGGTITSQSVEIGIVYIAASFVGGGNT